MQFKLFFFVLSFNPYLQWLVGHTSTLMLKGSKLKRIKTIIIQIHFRPSSCNQSHRLTQFLHDLVLCASRPVPVQLGWTCLMVLTDYRMHLAATAGNFTTQRTWRLHSHLPTPLRHPTRPLGIRGCWACSLRFTLHW